MGNVIITSISGKEHELSDSEQEFYNDLTELGEEEILEVWLKNLTLYDS